MLMKLFVVFSFIGILLSTTVHSQLQFNEINFDKAMLLAKKEKKLIFLIVEDSSCEKCNETGNKIFLDTSLDKKIKQNCIPVINRKGGKIDLSSLKNKFDINSYTALVFSNSGLLLRRVIGVPTFPWDYKNLIDSAISKSSNNVDNYENLQDSFARDTSNYNVLLRLIKARDNVEMNHDSLLEKLVKIIPADSLLSFSFLQYLAKEYPILSSDAYTALHKNHEAFDESWYRMSSSERSKINDIIIAKSLRKAIVEKNLSLAHWTASFAYGVYYNYFLGEDARYNTISSYYKGLGDTLSYLSTSIKYTKEVLMVINVDSIKKVDSLTFEKIKKMDRYKNLSNDSITIIHDLFIRQTSKSRTYGSRLNNLAWQIYLYTDDIDMIKSAINYVERSIQFYEGPEVYDTYAHLVYKTFNKERAISLEQKAVDEEKAMGFNTEGYEHIIAEMKKGVKKLD